MRLLTHNLLCCTKCRGYPLAIQADEVHHEAVTPIDVEMVFRLAQRIDWDILKQAHDALRAAQVKAFLSVPELPENTDEVVWENPEDVVVRSLHVLLNETSIVTGKLSCGSCRTVFPIADGIPNMIVGTT